MHIQYFSDGTPCECEYIMKYFAASKGNLESEVAHPCLREKTYFPNGKLQHDRPGLNSNHEREGIDWHFDRSGALAFAVPVKRSHWHGIYKEYNTDTGVLIGEIAFSHRTTHACFSMENFV